jgi:FixJ family two-component response regulator
MPTVAIVDDDEAVREALGDLLMVSGLACQCFESAAGFLAARQSRHFDCLVTDIRMPGMTGIELMERLNKERAQLPVVVLSSVLDGATRAKALALGVSAWLAKPVTDAHLLGAIATAMENAGPDAER